MLDSAPDSERHPDPLDVSRPTRQLDPMTRHLDATPESGRAFVQRDLDGPVVMLNLLRFRALADYSASPHLQPEAPISGEAAYAR